MYRNIEIQVISINQIFVSKDKTIAHITVDNF